MIRTRIIEERIAKEYSLGEIRCPIHLSIGQEAIATGVCKSLTKKDYIFSSHRSHAHYLSKNGSVEKFICEIYGKKNGCSSGIGGSMHLFDLDAGVKGCVPIVGSIIPIAVGAAFSNKLRGNNRTTVVFFGDGATEQGVLYESLNFAKIHNLSIIFICENNFYSIFDNFSLRQSSQQNIKKLPESLGISTFSRSGNDVEQVFKITKNALDKLKKKQQPFFFELKTYRILEHCGPNSDDHLKYRPKIELENWKKKCPIESYKKKLIKLKLISPIHIRKIEVSIKKKIDNIFKLAKKSPFQTRNILKKIEYEN